MACQEGSAGRHCIPGPARASLPEDTRGFLTLLFLTLLLLLLAGGGPKGVEGTPSEDAGMHPESEQVSQCPPDWHQPGSPRS